MDNSKALALLSLSRKGGNIALGEEAVGAAARAKKARLIVVANDASDHSQRRVKSFVSGTRQPYLQVPFSKDALGQALGTTTCAMAAITDVRLAQAFVKALDMPEQTAALLEDLDHRVARANQRQKEEKAHKNNVKYGKKSRG
jgi:ribosomal protein L7Ae-like RNA K-turn-binding protein